MKVIPKTTYIDQETGEDVTLETCSACVCNVFYLIGVNPDAVLACANCGTELPITTNATP